MTPTQLPAHWREWYEERAAIIEFDGGLSRERAEAEALRLVLAEMRKASPALAKGGDSVSTVRRPRP